MDFHTSRAQFPLDAATASVFNPWENPHRHSPVHRPQFPYNGLPISPLSPPSSSNSNSNLASSPQSMSQSNPWSSSSVSELEMLHQLRRRLAEREPCLPTPNQHFFDFDFSLPHLTLQLQPPSQPSQLPSQQPHQLHCEPSIPTPTTPSSSSTLFSSPPVSPTSHMSYRRTSPSESEMKRSSSDDRSDYSASPTTTTTVTTKKARACMSMKDFVPPDVTGMSKREARLVKNRAAAFLSRQRKREEFELMEIRVAELEHENARLRDLADGLSPQPTESSSDSPELELLRIQLAASHQREAELIHRLEAAQQEQKIKTEIYEPVLSDGMSSGANSPILTGSSLRNIVANPKGGASLGLMVLLCALPSLLSHPSSVPRSTLPTSQSFLDMVQWDVPSFFPSSATATEDVPSWELDYGGAASGGNTGNMEMDVDYMNVHNSEESQEWKKLDLGLEGGEGMGLAGLGLGALEISFATRRTEDGKIRVRVHSSPSSPASTSTSGSGSKRERVSSSTDDPADPALMTFSLPPPAQSSSSSSPRTTNSEGGVNPLSLSYIDTDPLGPFLGAGSSPTGTFELGSPFDFSNANCGSGLTGPQAALDGSRTGERRRVRIALRSLPQPGGEGGEWEVEVR